MADTSVPRSSAMAAEMAATSSPRLGTGASPPTRRREWIRMADTSVPRSSAMAAEMAATSSPRLGMAAGAGTAAAAGTWGCSASEGSAASEGCPPSLPPRTQRTAAHAKNTANIAATTHSPSNPSGISILLSTQLESKVPSPRSGSPSVKFVFILLYLIFPF